VTEKGFTAQLLRDLILGTGKYIPAAMQSLDRDEREAWFHASVLVRGQGTTDGYHEARVYIAPKAKKLLLQRSEARNRLGELSEWALKRAGEVRYNCLRRALFSLIEGGPSERELETKRREVGQWVDTWLARYDQHWGSGYFPWLWRTIEQTDEAARGDWLGELRALAMRVLEDALQTAPQRTGRRYRGKVRATGLFHGAFRRHFDKEMKNVPN
jgi:CRISPR system Cascade subunit CasA